MEEDLEDFLVFETSNSKNFWSDKIVNYLQERSIKFSYFRHKKIIIGNYILHFVSEYERERFAIGRINSKYFYNLETKFETDFKKTLKEILLNDRNMQF